MLVVMEVENMLVEHHYSLDKIRITDVCLFPSTLYTLFT